MTSHRPIELTGRSILLWDGTELSIGINGNGFMLTITAKRDGESLFVDANGEPTQVDLMVRDADKFSAALVKLSKVIKKQKQKRRQGPKNLTRARGGYARAQSLTPERRKEIARKAANARWNGTEQDGDMRAAEAKEAAE